MPATRSRRIVRCAVMALAVVVLLLVVYVGSVMMLFAASGADLIPRKAWPFFFAYIDPWWNYIEESQWFGHEECKRATWWCAQRGHDWRTGQ